jgi:hypothetical protein
MKVIDPETGKEITDVSKEGKINFAGLSGNRVRFMAEAAGVSNDLS